MLRLDVVGENGSIHEVRSVAAIPPEIELHVNQVPPETPRAVDGPVRLYPISPHLFPHLNAPPRFRPPPLAPVPDPTIHVTGFIPVPRGIRAAYNAPAVFLRGQPEMNPLPARCPDRLLVSAANNYP